MYDNLLKNGKSVMKLLSGALLVVNFPALVRVPRDQHFAFRSPQKYKRSSAMSSRHIHRTSALSMFIIEHLNHIEYLFSQAFC